MSEALASACERLDAVSSVPRLDAQRLLELALGRTVAWLFAHGEQPLEPDDAERFEAAVARRARGEPLAYIAGIAHFYGRSFTVSPAVLVPRPESEQLIALAVKHLRSQAGAGVNKDCVVCDVGTGSGILAVTLALEVPDAQVVALDLSAKALAVATVNVRAHGVGGRVRLMLGDLFAPLAAGQRFDCIIANLPYVASPDLAPLPDATAYEPRLALDGGPDGLAHYRRFVAEAPRRLAAGGLLLMEAGPATVRELAALARDSFGRFATIDIHADYARHGRVVSVRCGAARHYET